MNSDSSIEFLFICCIFLKQKSFANHQAAFAIGPAWTRGFAREALPAPATMATMKFEQFLVSKCEYMRCFVAGGVCEGSGAHLSLSNKVLAVVAKQLHFVGSVDSTTASRWVDIVTSSMLTPADKHDLIIHLNDKVDLEESVDDQNPGGPSSGSGGPSSGSVGLVPVGHTTPAATPKKSGKVAVEHKFLHNYGNERLWDVICDRTVTIDTTLSAMALFLSQLGMRWLSEKNSGSGYVPVQALQCIA